MDHFLTCLLFCISVHYGSMDSKWTRDSEKVLSPSPGPSLQLELTGPENFVALGATNLTIRYRLSPQIFNSSTPSLLSIHRPPMSFRLHRILKAGGEQFISSQDISHGPPISSSWEEVTFECGLIVRGGEYKVRVVDTSKTKSTNREDYYADDDYGMAGASSSFGGESLGTVSIHVRYPVIAFEVPHRLETYTTPVPISFGLTHSLLCKPRLPLPTTILTLSVCKLLENQDCNRSFVTILRDPFIRLQTEGQVKIKIECHYWGKNATYRIQIQDTEDNQIISSSPPIRVDWSPRFGLSLPGNSILPCSTGKNLRVHLSYPHCILPGKDKVRVFGHETTVPSHLAYNRLNYIGEQQIRPRSRYLDFPCSLFTPRFNRYCFQYVSTAVDDSVAVVFEKCIPTFHPDQFSDGGWGSWTAWSECSNTCGTKGKQFRYRFCDSPKPEFGANFCQGDAVEERPCDTILPDCPKETQEEDKSSGSKNKLDEDLNINSNQLTVETPNSFSFIPIHPSLNTNLTQTYGCECGCILDDIPPGSNSSLVVILSSNQSSCGDQDEEDHHHLKWVLNARSGESRIRFDVVDVDLHCMKLAFRDGNTSDSNLLDVFTSSRTRAEQGFSRGEEDVEEKLGVGGQRSAGGEDMGELTTTIRIESTGGSLSIAASESNQGNCAFQFLYLVAYYSATSIPAPAKSTELHDWVEYEFWTFLLVKVVLSCCVVTVLCSMFGGCATKAYKKYKYEQLKWSDSEWKADDPTTGEDGRGQTVSRCTSITLMSFDYTYWRRIRILRLKYFLLRPRKINFRTATTKSYPSTPTHAEIRRRKFCTVEEEDIKARGFCQNLQRNSHLYHSLSDTNLHHLNPRDNGGPTSGETSKKKSANPRQRHSFNFCPAHGSFQLPAGDAGNHPGAQRAEEEGGASKMQGRHHQQTIQFHAPSPGLEKCKLITSSTETSKTRPRGRRAFISVTIPDDEARHSQDSLSSHSPFTAPLHLNEHKTKNENLKILRQNQNEKAASRFITGSLTSEPGGLGSGAGTQRARFPSSEDPKLHKLLLQHRGKHPSQLSVTNMNSLTHLSSSCDSQDRVGLDEDTDHDFEMDYYDYDVLNAGNIPGSYLGLEPTFVLWNNDTLTNLELEPDQLSSTDTFNSDPQKEDPDSIYSCLRTTEANNLDRSVTDNTAIEMKKVDRAHFNLQPNSNTIRVVNNQIAETSLQAIKFADEDDDDNDNA